MYLLFVAHDIYSEVTLNNCKTLETFYVFLVSELIFAAPYEGKDIRKSDRYVPEPWVQKRNHGRSCE